MPRAPRHALPPLPKPWCSGLSARLLLFAVFGTHTVRSWCTTNRLCKGEFEPGCCRCAGRSRNRLETEARPLRAFEPGGFVCSVPFFGPTAVLCGCVGVCGCVRPRNGGSNGHSAPSSERRSSSTRGGRSCRTLRWPGSANLEVSHPRTLSTPLSGYTPPFCSRRPLTSTPRYLAQGESSPCRGEGGTRQGDGAIPRAGGVC